MAATRHISVALILFTLAQCIPAHGQSRGDSLRAALARVPTGKARITTLVALADWTLLANYGQAVQYADEAVQDASIFHDTTLLADALTQRAYIYWNNGAYDSSIALNKRAIQLREEASAVEALANNYFSIAMNYYYSADYDSAIVYHEEALTRFREAGNVRETAKVLNLIGLVYHQMGDYPKVIHYLKEFYTIRQELQGYQGRTYNLGHVSPYFRTDAIFQSELQLQIQSLEHLPPTNTEHIYLTHLNIADTYMELGDDQRSLAYHKKAAALARAIGWRPEYVYLGNAYRRIGQVDSAILIHRFALDLLRQTGSRLDLLGAMISLAKDYEAAGKFSSSITYYRMGLNFTSEMDNKLDVVLNAQRIARVLIAMNSFIEAKSYAAIALTTAQRVQSKTQVRNCFQLLAEIESGLGQFVSAFEYERSGRILSDSLVAGEADLQFAQTQVQLEVDRKNRDIERLNHEKELRDATITNKNLLILGFLIGLLLLILLAGSVYLRYRQNARANLILSKQNHQIETLLAEIHHRVKNNLQFISSLLSIQSGHLTNASARRAVLEGQGRVLAMGLIHENIYKARQYAFVNMNDYIKQLVASLANSFATYSVKTDVQASAISVDSDTAIPLGLIINELVTNCIKHAFRDVKDPLVAISLAHDNQHLLLEVSDNGVGMVSSPNGDTFGLRLVRNLASQLKGEITFCNDPGCHAVVRFQKFKLSPTVHAPGR